VRVRAEEEDGEGEVGEDEEEGSLRAAGAAERVGCCVAPLERGRRRAVSRECLGSV